MHLRTLLAITAAKAALKACHLTGRPGSTLPGKAAMKIDPHIIEKYLKTENKRVARLDRQEVQQLGARIIEGDIFSIEDERVRHNALKTAYLIFSYLMEEA